MTLPFPSIRCFSRINGVHMQAVLHGVLNW
jgi:hypothetical protein